MRDKRFNDIVKKVTGRQSHLEDWIERLDNLGDNLQQPTITVSGKSVKKFTSATFDDKLKEEGQPLPPKVTEMDNLQEQLAELEATPEVQRYLALKAELEAKLEDKGENEDEGGSPAPEPPKEPEAPTYTEAEVETFKRQAKSFRNRNKKEESAAPTTDEPTYTEEQKAEFKKQAKSFRNRNKKEEQDRTPDVSIPTIIDAILAQYEDALRSHPTMSQDIQYYLEQGLTGAAGLAKNLFNFTEEQVAAVIALDSAESWDQYRLEHGRVWLSICDRLYGEWPMPKYETKKLDKHYRVFITAERIDDQNSTVRLICIQPNGLLAYKEKEVNYGLGFAGVYGAARFLEMSSGSADFYFTHRASYTLFDYFSAGNEEFTALNDSQAQLHEMIIAQRSHLGNCRAFLFDKALCSQTRDELATRTADEKVEAIGYWLLNSNEQATSFEDAEQKFFQHKPMVKKLIVLDHKLRIGETLGGVPQALSNKFKGESWLPVIFIENEEIGFKDGKPYLKRVGPNVQSEAKRLAGFWHRDGLRYETLELSHDLPPYNDGTWPKNAMGCTADGYVVPLDDPRCNLGDPLAHAIDPHAKLKKLPSWIDLENIKEVLYITSNNRMPDSLAKLFTGVQVTYVNVAKEPVDLTQPAKQKESTTYTIPVGIMIDKAFDDVEKIKKAIQHMEVQLCEKGFMDDDTVCVYYTDRATPALKRALQEFDINYKLEEDPRKLALRCDALITLYCNQADVLFPQKLVSGMGKPTMLVKKNGTGYTMGIDWTGQRVDRLATDAEHGIMLGIRVGTVKESGTNPVYIGRGNSKQPGSALANPYKLTSEDHRREVIRKYEDWLVDKINKRDEDVLAALRAICTANNKGIVTLTCFCKAKDNPKACHGDVIRKVIYKRLYEIEGLKI